MFNIGVLSSSVKGKRELSVFVFAGSTERTMVFTAASWETDDVTGAFRLRIEVLQEQSFTLYNNKFYASSFKYFSTTREFTKSENQFWYIERTTINMITNQLYSIFMKNT